MTVTKRLGGTAGVMMAFSAGVATLNLDMLWPIILPPLAPLVAAPWFDFLALPLAAASAGGVITAIGRGGVVAANLVFWLVFFATAEWRRIELMMPPGQGGPPDCIEATPFLRSLTFAGEPFQFQLHAAYVRDGRVMLWSYRDLGWFEIGPNTYRNLEFDECRDAIPTAEDRQ